LARGEEPADDLGVRGDVGTEAGVPVVDAPAGSLRPNVAATSA
jgi:hypothetical protein